MNLWIFGFKFINLVENHIMRYLFVFLLFINSILVQSQTEKQPNCADIDGLLITDYDELDNISASYSGIVFDCSYTGKVNALYHFKNGKKDGLSRNWGRLASEGNYINGKKNGLWRTWHNGQLESEGNYKEDARDGIWKHWYDNGQLEEEITYKVRYSSGYAISERDGVRRKWSEDGQKELEWHYKNGNEEGLFRWWRDGKLDKEHEIKNGKRIREKKWDESGNVLYEKCWDSNKKRIKCPK